MKRLPCFSFKTYSNLKTHMDTHGDTAYECYVCRRVLNSRRTLRKHLLVHEDKCRHVCSYCNKAFKRRQTLKVRIKAHSSRELSEPSARTRIRSFSSRELREHFSVIKHPTAPVHKRSWVFCETLYTLASYHHWMFTWIYEMGHKKYCILMYRL